jgi:competence protein ComEC
VDAGPAGQGGTNLAYVAERLEALGVDTLEALVLSHAHTDHFDGMSAVLDRVHARVFYYNGQVRNFFRYQSLVTQAARDAARVTVSFATDLNLGTSSATRVRILPPLATYLSDPNAESAEINNGSLGTVVTRGAFSLFIAGDGEVEANERWRTAFANQTRNVTALKVGHHGANDAIFDNGSSGPSLWLAHTSPALQLISANGTTHPRIRALAALLARSSETYCTSVHGDITVRIDDQGANWTVSVQRNAGAVCVPGSAATT